MSIADLSIWNPVTCFAACAGVYVIGECLSRLTKGNVSSLMFASAIFLFGFWLNILPDNVTSAPGLAAAMSNFGVGLLSLNLCTNVSYSFGSVVFRILNSPVENSLCNHFCS